MIVSILSQNVQGLNDLGKLDIVKNYFRSLLRKVDINCFQETKLRGARLQGIKDTMWPGAGFFAQEAAVAYNNSGNEEGVGKGGLCLWLAPRLVHLISATGQSRDGHAHWIRLHGVPGQDLAILNVYAPHTSAQRCALWADLLANLPGDCRWVLVGDWNFTERSSDKSSQRAPSTTEEERQVFAELKDQLQVVDDFPVTNRPRFSWDSKRKEGPRTMARLDRVYSFHSPADPVTGENYRIFGDCAHSDHLPVWRQLRLAAVTKRPSPFVMNANHLRDKSVQEGIRGVWARSHRLPFFGKIRRCVKYFKEHCLRKAAEDKKEEAELRQQLERTTLHLQADPGNGQAQGELSDVAGQLMNFEKKKSAGQRLRSRLKWKTKGDQCSHEFFQANKERSTASHITELMDADGTVHNQQQELERICKEYYGKLYTARPEANEGAITQVLSYLSDKLSAPMKDSLSATLSLGELHKAMMEMQTGKSPGPDGIVLEFYRIFWDMLGAEYLAMLEEGIAQGRLPNGVTQGMIALLHKGGERRALTNWRPITLLNMGYKIYAKALQLRLQPVLMETISPNQSAFLPMRFILDNLLLTQETIA